nr:hypothetical protein GCM10020092_062310 [Actinoplanes digitatis]
MDRSTPGSVGTGMLEMPSAPLYHLRVRHPVGERQGQPERDDAQVVRLDTQGGCADEQPDRGGRRDREHRGHPESQAGLGGEYCRRVRADAEERHLREVDLPADAHCQAETDGEQREEDDHVDDVDGVRVQPVRQQPGRDGQRRESRDPVPHARFTVRSPKMPVGRIMMITVKTRKVTSSE